MIINRQHTVIVFLSLTASALFLMKMVNRVHGLYSRFAPEIINGLSVIFNVNR